MILHLRYCPAQHRNTDSRFQLKLKKEVELWSNLVESSFTWYFATKISSNMLCAAVSFIILNVYLSEHYLGHCLIASHRKYNLSLNQTIYLFPPPSTPSSNVE